MQVFKPYVCVSRKGMFFAHFGTADEAAAYAKQVAASNHVTMAVAKVIRTVEPGSQETERDAGPPPTLDTEEMPAAPLSIPDGVGSLVEVAHG